MVHSSKYVCFDNMVILIYLHMIYFIFIQIKLLIFMFKNHINIQSYVLIDTCTKLDIFFIDLKHC